MNPFKLWLLYCIYCSKNNIAAPSYGDFMKGKTTTFIDFGLNI